MPLNDKLHRALLRIFGAIRIAKEREPARFRVETGRGDQRWARIIPGSGGEEYRVNCPFCGDTRFRLHIGHRVNTADPATGARFGVNLACCFNDGCDLNADAPPEWRRARCEQLRDMLKPYIARGMNLRTTRAIAAHKPREMCLPAVHQPLHELPAHHPAMQYLTRRGFDPAILASESELYYCAHDRNPFVSGRIIIPIRMGGKLVGSQARVVAEPVADEPKYYTAPGTPKSRVLYNYDHAKETMFGVIVEGPADAWKVGPQAVAILGSSLSQTQLGLIGSAWGSTGVALMLDPDFVKKPRHDPSRPTQYERIRGALSTPGLLAWGLLEVILPDGTDPGSLDRATIWDHVHRAARAQRYGHVAELEDTAGVIAPASKG